LRPQIVTLLGPALERSARSRRISCAEIIQFPPAALNREVPPRSVLTSTRVALIPPRTHFAARTTGGLPPDHALQRTAFHPIVLCVLHEAGHGLYEQGLPAEHYGTPLGSAASLGIHESHPRLWENHAGRSQSFWEHWHPVVCRHFAELHNFRRHKIAGAQLIESRPRSSGSRPTKGHLRLAHHFAFEIELKLIEGQLAVADVPACWN